VVFKLDRAGKETVLHSFTGGEDGAIPFAGVFQNAGILYGTTYNGGGSDFGTVFKVDKSGKVTVLYRFSGGTDGAHPAGTSVRDAAGNIYGTASGCGLLCNDVMGKVFRVDKTGHEIVLHAFTGGEDGATPLGGVVRDSHNNLYGTTYYGGGSGCK
jgi:uncharacterized repeat protein (TIGR03803 family)